jgi:predicted glycogen debranching enzyme
MIMIQFEGKDCQDLSKALSHEWLETNGLGGYASSTITGLNTRRYHSLLTASFNPPLERFNLLSKLEETIIINGHTYELSSNQYPSAIFPQGHQYLKSFRLDPFPIFIYETPDAEIKKTIFMVYGENTTVVSYQVRPKNMQAKIELQIKPLLAYRDYHCLTHENQTIHRSVDSQPGMIAWSPYEGLPSIYIAHDADKISTEGSWYKNFEYEAEMQRGLDFSEDLYNPLTLSFDLNTRYNASLIFSTKTHDIKKAGDLQNAELKRRREIVSQAPIDDPFVRQLTLAADQFIVKRKDQKTILAGYHWFTDWGRDSMIALPGLTLVTGRIETAKSILLTFARHADCGMIPNRFPDTGAQAEYNTVDATLWFFEAVRALLKYSGDYRFIKDHFYSVFMDIINWHVKGTRFGIKMDEDGLLTSGQQGIPLTWMDAKVGDSLVVPRYGKPVEVQVLWYNALCFMEELADIFGDKPNQEIYHRMSLKAKQSFNNIFWNESQKCLYDCISGAKKDASIRPNQIFAVSLPHALLDATREKWVVDTVEKELLTPFGLRSLSPKDPQYQAHCQGDPWSRDRAYHQGTVWSWLLGPFITAYLKVNRHSEPAQAQAKLWIKNIEAQMFQAGLGQISEIFDGDAPHTPRGCIAQAWSVGEILRTTVEDVYKVSFTTLLSKSRN